ncbi:MAG: hypothetical protein HPY61_06075 [Methanotrichaceae archaeon]|nr:hypothetical protein [Methanotrichaceae archaeon]
MSFGKLFVVILIFAAIIGTAAGDTSTEAYYVYKMEQKVDGNGFFSAYKNVTAGSLNLGNLAHGSGSYSDESLLESRNLAINDSRYTEAVLTSDSEITYNESVDYAYSPRSFYFGKSFRSDAFDSKGMEMVCLKNYGSNISINSRFDSLETLSKDITSSLYWKSVTSDDIINPFGEFSRSREMIGKSRFSLDAAFTGRGHLGVLELNGSLHDVKTFIDEDYLGTYSISKRITHDFYYLDKFQGDSWLPCCFGGWNDMMYFDQKGFGKSASGVFDCTCYKAPTTAQFPRVYI